MKRPSIHMMETSSSSSNNNNNSNNNNMMIDDGELLGQSLKRVRISTSPGELRLDRDLQQLGWATANRYLTEHIWLDRVHALRLVLVISKRTTLHIDVPRMYPHAAPKVVRATQEDALGNTETTASSTPLSIPDYKAWSPIQTIQDYIQYLLEQLSLQGDMEVDAIELPSKHQSLFAPNRFDVGYDRSIPAKAMEC